MNPIPSLARAWMLTLPLALSPWLLAGCAFKGDLTDARHARIDATAWRPEPQTLRVYPSTRFARHDGQLLLEARLELLDAMGDAIKASGDFHLRLMTAGHVSGKEEPLQLYQWDVKLRALIDHQNTYDPITNTYLFRLKLNQAQPPKDDTTLHVTFTPVHAAPRKASDTPDTPDTPAAPTRLQAQATLSASP